MALFQKIIVKKYLNNLSNEQIDNSYEQYSEQFLNPNFAERVRLLKEEQYQEGFLRDLFVKCLGYTINPFENYDLTTEFKNLTDAEKADGAILKDGKAIAVIELKSTKCKDMRSIEKQAFNYKAHQQNCKYVITSNFERIRLYIDNATEFEEFNVFDLTNDEFKFLYLCLSRDSIFDDIPAKMKEKSNLHEQHISKKLYNDYAEFRNKIFQNLTINNPQIDKLILFKKAQKLLDRFLFIFFAEDKGLIPPNLISKIINDYNKLKELDYYTPLFKVFVKYFCFIDEGHESDRMKIEAYNGGLFEKDEILDNVTIDDEVLIEDSLKLSNYDFDSEVDVNILGHIFEHSLTDIEKLNAELSGEELDKKQTRRKKEGVYYTPNYITKYIVENTVGTLCHEKKEELGLLDIEIDNTCFRITKSKGATLNKKGREIYEKFTSYKKWLLSLKILDPACGSGAFLNQALNFLIEEHNFIKAVETVLISKQLVKFDVESSVLENNLYGVDINEEAVEIAKLSLWLKTAHKGRKLTDLSKHIKCGNSLIDDTEVAGEKAFDWDKEFPDIMKKGGFDVVIGNPPYVLCQPSNTKQEILNYYNSFKVAGYKIDLFHLFFEKSINLLKYKGLLGFISPNTFMTNKYIQKLRAFILSNCDIKNIIIFNKDVFNDASVDVSTTILRKAKSPENEIKIYKMTNTGNLFDISIKSQKEWEEDADNIFNINPSFRFDKTNCIKLGEISTVTFGLQTKDKKTFVKETQVDNDWEECYTGKDVNRYYLSPSSLFFKNNKEIVKAGGSWDMDIHHSTKIVVRQIGNPEPIFAYDQFAFATLNTLYSIVIKSDDVALKYLLSILNSSFIKEFWNYNFSDNKQLFPKIKGYQLKQIPIKIISETDQKPFIEKADIMLSLNKQKQNKTSTFLHRLETNFKIEKFSNKLKSFYEYDFKTFVSELNKKKIKLTLPQQDEWEEYFNAYKNEIVKLQQTIDTTDKEIDQMVYELYGLTNEEIAIVENETEK